MGGLTLALLVVGGVLLVAVSGGVCGAAAAVWTLYHSATGERKRFAAELAPVREAVSELGDRFDHFYRREAKRDRDAGVVRSGDAPSPASEATERRNRLAQVRARFIRGAR